MTKDTDQESGQGKVCTKCGEWKALSYYYRRSGASDGRMSRCKICQDTANREYYAEHPERRRAVYDKYISTHKEQIKERRIKKYQVIKDKENARARKYHAENRDAIILRNKIWHEQNRERKRERAYALRNTPKGRIDDAMSSGIYSSVKKGSKGKRKWEDLVGYSVFDLMSSMEKKFQPGMTWQNFGKGGWEIDHIIPKSLFNYETPDNLDFKRCWALSNLQPLWGDENRAKTNKYDGAFQPSLPI